MTNNPTMNNGMNPVRREIEGLKEMFVLFAIIKKMGVLWETIGRTDLAIRQLKSIEVSVNPPLEFL